MEILTILSCHNHPNIVFDTLHSIQKNLSKDVLLLVDGVGWKYFDRLKISVPILKGLNHGYFKSPYRNIILGLIHTYKHWPNYDWYCYTEYDSLFTSNEILNDLKKAKEKNIWMVGCDYRRKQNYAGKRTVKLEYVEKIIKEEFDEIHYLLGSVLFYSGEFLKKLIESEFLEKFLFFTNSFVEDFFPGYIHTSKAAWDVIEHLMPTLCRHWGGEILELSKWNDKSFEWSGNYKTYPIRWQPEIDRDYEFASIIHPVKDYNSVARKYFREKRELIS